MSTQSEALRTRLKASTPEDKIVLVEVLNARCKYDEAVADTAAAAARTEYWVDKAEEDRTRSLIALRVAVVSARDLGVPIDNSEVF